MGGTNHQKANKDHNRGILGISPSTPIKDVYKVYKSLVTKWSPDKNPSNKKEAEAKIKDISEPYNVLHEPDSPKHFLGDQRTENDDESFFRRSCSILGRSSSRRCRTPNPTRPSMAKATSRRCRTPTGRSTTPFLGRNWSRRNGDEADQTPSFSRNASRAGSVNRNGNETPKSPRFSRSSSRSTGPTPILFSSSTSRGKPPPIENVLECSLEDLCHGFVKKIMVTRDVMTKTGQVEKEDEMLQIKVSPGWKKGTKITFEGKVDERRGTHAADIIFTVDEKKHSTFRRHGDDLEVFVEIPLLKALTGCTLSVPLLGDEKMKLAFDNVIYPGFVKIIRGQGMPKPKEPGKRGDLHIKFLVKFPAELNQEKRQEVYSILKDCC